METIIKEKLVLSNVSTWKETSVSFLFTRLTLQLKLNAFGTSSELWNSVWTWSGKSGGGSLTPRLSNPCGLDLTVLRDPICPQQTSARSPFGDQFLLFSFMSVSVVLRSELALTLLLTTCWKWLFCLCLGTYSTSGRLWFDSVLKSNY